MIFVDILSHDFFIMGNKKYAEWFFTPIWVWDLNYI